MKKIGRKNPEKKEFQNDLVTIQAKRIAELKEENATLIKRLDEYATREKDVTETLAFAKKKCDEMVSEAKIQYALECEKLKIFRQKWLTAAKDGYLLYGLEQTDKILQECRKELEKAFADDLGITDYLSERERINADPSLNYRAIIAENESALPRQEKPACLTDKELEELLKQL